MTNFYSEIYKARKSRAAVIKQLLELIYLDESIENNLLSLNGYANSKPDIDILDCKINLLSYGYKNLFKGAGEVLSEAMPLLKSSYCLANSYFMESIKQDYVWHKHVFNSDEYSKKLQRMEVDKAGLFLGFSSIFSTQLAFEKLLELVISAQDQNFYRVNAELKYGAQLFMIQLATEFLKMPQRDWSAHFNGEPLFDEILIHWNDEDDSELKPLLVQLCNRHTHHTRASTSKNNHDFDHLGLYHFPVEVLMVLRLRQWSGLSIPEIKHPLMEAPFDKLPEINRDYSDELLEKVNARARKDYPDFEKVLEQGIKGAKAWQPIADKIERESVPLASSQVDHQKRLCEWFTKEQVSQELKHGQQQTAKLAQRLLQKEEVHQLNILLSHSQLGYRNLKNTPISKLVNLPDSDAIWHPASLLQDWSLLQNWAMDLADDADEIQNFIERRLSLLQLEMPDSSLLSNVSDEWDWDDNPNRYDLFDAQVSVANQLLNTLGYCFVSLDIGRSEYVVYLTSIDNKERLSPFTSIDNLNVNIEF